MGHSVGLCRIEHRVNGYLCWKYRVSMAVLNDWFFVSMVTNSSISLEGEDLDWSSTSSTSYCNTSMRVSSLGAATINFIRDRIWQRRLTQNISHYSHEKRTKINFWIDSSPATSFHLDVTLPVVTEREPIGGSSFTRDIIYILTCLLSQRETGLGMNGQFVLFKYSGQYPHDFLVEIGCTVVLQVLVEMRKQLANSTMADIPSKTKFSSPRFTTGTKHNSINCFCMHLFCWTDKNSFANCTTRALSLALPINKLTSWPAIAMSAACLENPSPLKYSAGDPRLWPPTTGISCAADQSDPTCPHSQDCLLQRCVGNEPTLYSKNLGEEWFLPLLTYNTSRNLSKTSYLISWKAV
uniref:Uncharacterized protein n=1 Tax=Timema cristinae TaxID=61476 RepID=A0A7R9DBJ0_TIMCR|nr:unnamed protein product [Timema cristinae]